MLWSFSKRSVLKKVKFGGIFFKHFCCHACHSRLADFYREISLMFRFLLCNRFDRSVSKAGNGKRRNGKGNGKLQTEYE